MNQKVSNQKTSHAEVLSRQHDLIQCVHDNYAKYLSEQAKILLSAIQLRKKLGSHDEVIFLKIQLGIIKGIVSSSLKQVYNLHKADKDTAYYRIMLEKGKAPDDWEEFRDTFSAILKEMLRIWEAEENMLSEDEDSEEYYKTMQKLEIIRKLIIEFDCLCQECVQSEKEKYHGIN